MKIHIESISKSYAGNVAIDKVSFHFEGGGVYALSGHNGSGKSTLLRIISMLEEPDSGTVERLEDDGSPIESGTGLRRRMTLLLPETGLFNDTVFGNVAFGLRLRGISKDEIQARVENALKACGMSKEAGSHAYALSSGQAKRVGLARAIVIEADALLLDEPTSSVDEENAEIIEGMLYGIKSQGYAVVNPNASARTRPLVIIATHDSAMAERLCDRVLNMRHGRMLNRLE